MRYAPAFSTPAFSTPAFSAPPRDTSDNRTGLETDRLMLWTLRKVLKQLETILDTCVRGGI